MCGIAGVIGQSNSAALVAIMNAAQARRGPDSEGLHSWGDHVTLGHRRLSIFDLESCVLSGSISERQRDWQTGEWTYIIQGRAMDGREVAVVVKWRARTTMTVLTAYEV